MNMSGKYISWFRGPIKRFIFPRHVHWTCLGKFLIPWGSPEGGTFPRHVHQKHQKNFYPVFFLMGVVWVMVGLGVWSSNTTLFHDEKLAFFGLGVRIYPKFLDCFGFSLNFEILGFWRPPRSDSGGPGGDGTRSLHQVFYPHFLKKMEMSLPTTSKNPFSMFFI